MRPSRSRLILRRAIALGGLGVIVVVMSFVLLDSEDSGTADDGLTVTYGAEGAEGASAPTDPTSDVDAVQVKSEQRAFKAAINRGVRKAEALGGSAALAVWKIDWPNPIAAGERNRRWRMWSTAKAVSAVAMLEEGFSDASSGSRAVKLAMQAALVRSENCRQRLVLLNLADATGPSQSAEEALTRVLSRAGAVSAELSDQRLPPDAKCAAFLQAQPKLKDPLRETNALGTATWTATDAVSFAHALQSGTFGAAGEQVREWLGEPKRPSRELERQSDFSADIDWGAGNAFEGLNPRYKAGWGGAKQGSFVAGQLAIFTTDLGHYAVAAYFQPERQPALDDPGLTKAPQAIELMFSAVKQAAQ